jgi:ketosteroid isomerase-like protein
MSNQTEELSGLAKDWASAELGRDTASLKEILADDFVGVGPRGFVLTKKQWIARHDAGNLKYGSFGLDEMTVRLYGDSAIVVCRQTVAGVYEDENGRYDIDERFRATLVFVKQDGGRRLAGLQLSLILGRRVAGPGDDVEALHGWLFDGDYPSPHGNGLRLSEPSRAVIDETLDATGATVAGRRTYELSRGWGGRRSRCRTSSSRTTCQKKWLVKTPRSRS